MRPIILVSVISITAALIFYTVAVWRNWRSQLLTVGTIVLFWCGLATDVLATTMMRMSVEKTTYDLHTISGYSALALMLALTLVGTGALVIRKDDLLKSFHRIAMPVWVLWALSYATGVIVGVQRV